MRTRWSYQLVVRSGPPGILPRNTLPSATNDQEKKRSERLNLHMQSHLSLLPVTCALVENLFLVGIEWIKPAFLFLVAKKQQV